jgi:hypothetical protein
MDYEVVRNWHFEPVVRDYTAQETILYNLAIGFGPRDLQQVWEERLEAAFPTMAFVLGWPGGWMKDPETGIDYTRVVHGEQRLKAFAPLPAVGRITGQSRVAHVVDKGVGKGAVVVTETELTDASGQTLALVTQSNFCRGDGGLAKSDPPPQGLAALPDRGCDRVADLFLPENAAARCISIPTGLPAPGSIGRSCMGFAPWGRLLASSLMAAVLRHLMSGFRHRSFRARPCRWTCGRLRAAQPSGFWHGIGVLPYLTAVSLVSDVRQSDQATSASKSIRISSETSRPFH